MKESILQQQICEFLSLHGIFYFAPLNESAMLALKKSNVPEKTRYIIINFLKKMGMVPGLPDLAILANKTVYFMELKVGKNTTSEKQNRISTILIKLGYNVAIIHSFTEAEEILKIWRVVK